MPKGAKFIRPVKVRLIVGPPLHPEVGEAGGRASRRAVKALTDELEGCLQSLFDEAQAG
jgi:hypothetical protein